MSLLDKVSVSYVNRWPDIGRYVFDQKQPFNCLQSKTKS
jgi:hypothetical protein